MRETPEDFWAKLKITNGEVVEWHPLLAHCADVAAVAEALLQRSILRRRHARLLGLDDLSSAHIGRLAYLVALHDAGKTNHGFQRKAFDEKGRREGHVSVILNLLLESRSSIVKEAFEALALVDMADWFDTEAGLWNTLSATLAHHGRPVAAETPATTQIWQPNDVRDPVAGLRRLRTAAESWFPAAFTDDVEPFDPSPPFQHAFNGLVTLADWIGSDDSIFEYADSLEDRMPDARRFAAEAVEEMGLAPSSYREELGHEPPDFSRVSEFPPYEIQQACMDLDLHERGSLTILESNTGSGKTEAVLARFLRLFHAGLVDGLYFALPTRTAATQLHVRVTEAMKRAFDENESPQVVLAVPGYLRVDDSEGRRAQDVDPRLPKFEVLWPDNESERFRYRAWAAEQPKRYLSGVIAVGTIDQALLSCLQVNHAQLRATSLMRHLLVVDEVHASDEYMTTLLEEVLDRHLEAGGHALLMSATLGSAAASRFLKQSTMSYERAVNLPYPLLRHVSAAREDVELVAARAQHAQDDAPELDKDVRPTPIPIAGDAEAIAQRALDAASEGARVLVIRNTVGLCMDVQQALEQQTPNDDSRLFRVAGRPAPHHSRYAAADRKTLDERIEEDLGKRSDRSGFVVVATQTVEQSLDLDADLMLTDLCPIDVLLQRVGRLHRHQRRRPAGFEQPRVEVLVPDSRDLSEYITQQGKYGHGYVYADLRIIELTWRLVEDRDIWSIPEHNRELVEFATHPARLDAVATELGDVWSTHQKEVRGNQLGDRQQARLSKIKRDKPFAEAAFPPEIEDSRPKTRLGLEDRRVGFEEPIVGPFGHRLSELTIPQHLCRHVPADVELATNVRADENSCTFRFDTLTFHYDRLGLHRLEG